MKVLANHVKYCPALPRIAARVYRGNVDRMLPRAMQLLEREQMLVITGTDRLLAYTNRSAGKTRLANKIRKRLNAQGKKVAYYNLQEQMNIMFLIDHGVVNDTAMKHMLEDLGQKEDVYIFDEAQWGHVTESYPRSKYNDLLALYWKELGELLKEGKRIIFVTLDHPFNLSNRQNYYDRTSVRYFTSPIIEVESS